MIKITQIGKYNGFVITYEDGRFVAVKGSNRFELPSEVEVKVKVDSYLRELELARPKKPRKIKDYKGFVIKYGTGGFWAEKKGVVLFKNEQEHHLTLQIDEYAQKEKTDRENFEIQKKQEEQLKKQVKQKIVFDAKDFKEMIGAIAKYQSEAVMKFDKGKLVIQVMDPANVAMIKRVLAFKGKHCFSSLLAINCTNLMMLLRKIAVQDVKVFEVSFRLEGDKVKFVISNGFGQFELPTITQDLKEIKMPELKPSCSFVMTGTEFMNYVRLADAVSESINFQAVNGHLNLFTNDDEPGALHFKKEQAAPLTLVHEYAKSKYSLEYLKKFSTNKDATYTFKFGRDYPLTIEDEKGNWFCLAPRVDSE